MMNLVTLQFADTGDFDHMNGWGGGWMWLWGVAMMVLFVVLLAWLFRAGGSPTGPAPPTPRSPHDRAKEILAERYASGDISTEEFRERNGELQ